MRRFFWLGCLVSLVLAGCGSSSKPSNPGAAGTTATTTAPPPGLATATTKAPTFSGSGNSKYCDLARQFSKNVNINVSGDLKASFQQFDTLVPQFLAAVPSELKADANLLVTAVRQFETELKAANYDFTKINPSSVQSLQDPKFTAAADRLSAYNLQVCGISTTPST